MLQDRYYHAARAAQEREMAMASANLTARGIHLEMASRHEALAASSGDSPIQMEELKVRAGKA